MKKSTLLPVCLLAIFFLPLIACGLAPLDKNAAATQAAATIFAGQTAQAQAFTPTPADTPTPHPTPTPVEPTSTPTPPPTATRPPTSTPTPTDTPQPVDVSTLGEGVTCTGAFGEDFSHPSRDWPSGSSQYGRWGPSEGEYQIRVQEANYFLSWSNGLRTADFILEVDAYHATDVFGAYGLIFGLNSLDNGQDFYAFFVDATSYFALFKHTDEEWTTLVDWTESPALATGKEVNRLRVERRKDTISLGANGQTLVTTRDDTYMGQGYITLAAESFDTGGVDVRFDNIVACLSPKTWPAPLPTPTAPPATPTPPAPPDTPTPVPPAAPSVPAGKGALIMLNCRGETITVDVIPAGIFQELAPKTGPDCQPGKPIELDPGNYTLRATIPGVPSKGEATITIEAGVTLTFTWY